MGLGEPAKPSSAQRKTWSCAIDKGKPRVQPTSWVLGTLDLSLTRVFRLGGAHPVPTYAPQTDHLEGRAVKDGPSPLGEPASIESPSHPPRVPSAQHSLQQPSSPFLASDSGLPCSIEEKVKLPLFGGSYKTAPELIGDRVTSCSLSSAVESTSITVCHVSR